MRPPPNNGPSEPLLFDAAALRLAEEQHEGSHFRWLSLAEEPEAMNMRRVLEHCWTLAGDSQLVLAKGLAHERWGQHAGALAHLLALGLFAREGFEVLCEPDLGRQTPDLLATLDSHRVLVEVRSITGSGTTPWDRETPAGEDEKRVDPPPRRLSSTGSERAARTRARRAAAQRAAAVVKQQEDLSDAVVRVIQKKAAAYKELCAELSLPYIICIYQDTDTQIPPMVCQWAFGRGSQEQCPDGHWHSTHDPADGTFFGDRWHFAHVSAVLVFGRCEDEEGQLFMRGDLILNPFAERPLPNACRFPHLRCYRLRTNVKPARMRWTPCETEGFEITPHP